jgi:hypothetical protein
MSNYSAPTRHPVTGAIEMADWLDDHDGKHRYGVRFPSDGKIYGSRECFECTWPDLLGEIERLRAALRRIAHAPHGKIYCADGHEEAVLIARAALRDASDDAAT